MAEEKTDNPPKEGGFAEAMMMADGEAKKAQLEKATLELQAELEASGEKIRELVIAQPPTGLLGYLWSQFFMGVLRKHQDGEAEAGPDKDLIRQFQFVLEYVHAVWSSHKGDFVEGQVDEGKAKELIEICDKLSTTAMFYAMASRNSVSALRLQCDDKGKLLVASCSDVKSPPILRNDYAELKAEADRQLAKFTKGEKSKRR
jgi:hypothetical protein